MITEKSDKRILSNSNSDFCIYMNLKNNLEFFNKSKINTTFLKKKHEL